MDEKILENEEIIENHDSEVVEPEIEDYGNEETCEESNGSGIGSKLLKIGGGIAIGAGVGYALKRFVGPKVSGAIGKIRPKRKTDREFKVVSETTEDGVKVMTLREIRNQEVKSEESENED